MKTASTRWLTALLVLIAGLAMAGAKDSDDASPKTKKYKQTKPAETEKDTPPATKRQSVAHEGRFLKEIEKYFPEKAEKIKRLREENPKRLRHLVREKKLTQLLGVMRVLERVFPGEYSRLMELKKTDPEAFKAKVQQISKWIRDSPFRHKIDFRGHDSDSRTAGGGGITTRPARGQRRFSSRLRRRDGDGATGKYRDFPRRMDKSPLKPGGSKERMRHGKMSHELEALRRKIKQRTNHVKKLAQKAQNAKDQKENTTAQIRKELDSIFQLQQTLRQTRLGFLEQAMHRMEAEMKERLMQLERTTGHLKEEMNKLSENKDDFVEKQLQQLMDQNAAVDRQ